ncbi:MAG: beta-propeller domain-containing protein [Hyphomonadaceae bacterium]
MKLRLLAAAAALVFVGAAGEAETPVRGSVKAETAQPPLWRTLERFANDADFMRYVREVHRLNGHSRRWDFEDGAVATDAVPAPPPPPPPPPPPAPGAAPAPSQQLELSATLSTDSLLNEQPASGEPSSITNVQTQGVDEGGIVKQVGRFLIVLQDGRLFVVDTRNGEAPGLSLASRTNVYRSTNQDTWFDELLTSGNRILVAGYSYREQASEITILTIDDDGQLTREATYYISSNDYYDIENYATRLVNGNLVIYTPLDISNVNPRVRMRWPVVRRWLRDGDRRAVTTEGRSLFDGNDIYRPVQRVFQPMVHSVSVCPLGDLSAGRCHHWLDIGVCRAATRRILRVVDHRHLSWVTPHQWDAVLSRNCELPGAPSGSVPATVFQVPLNGDTPRHSTHADCQRTSWALDGNMEEFLGQRRHGMLGPARRTGSAQVRYFHTPLSTFRTTPREAAEPPHTAPSPAGQYEVRYTHVRSLYGGDGMEFVSTRSGPNATVLARGRAPAGKPVSGNNRASAT